MNADKKTYYLCDNVTLVNFQPMLNGLENIANDNILIVALFTMFIFNLTLL